MSSIFECETIVFGKGIGESILVRLAESEWMIIDSCLNDAKKPAALHYLAQRGVNYKTDVKLIIISHFHDDHIKGLSEIIRECTDAKVIISAALNTAEFEAYIKALSSNGPEMAKTKEITQIMAELRTVRQRRGIVYGKRDCTLYRSAEGIEVLALSPCDNDIVSAQLDFANSLKIANNMSEIATSAKLVNPNHYCVVTRIYSPTSMNNEILLGADLEVVNNSGWDSVCDAFNSPKPNKVSIFKLPHHGSATGFHQRTWDELLGVKPISLLTTYDKSSLPRKDLIDTYKSLSKAVYCTSPPKYTEEKKSNNTTISEVEKILSKMEISVKFSNTNNKFGVISVNKCLTSDPAVTVSHAATPL